MSEADCNESLTELYYFLDGELTDERRADIRKHLEECVPCLEHFDFESELRAVIARSCQEEVPESLRSRIAEMLGIPFGDL